MPERSHERSHQGGSAGADANPGPPPPPLPQQQACPGTTELDVAMQGRCTAAEVVITANKGRGLSATRCLRRGEVIQTCCGILVPREEYDAHCCSTVFRHYLFVTPNRNYMLALGVGSLFNHSNEPNVDYRVSEKSRTVHFFAARAIDKGEELTIYYGASLSFASTLKGKERGDAADSSEDSSEDEDLPFLHSET